MELDTACLIPRLLRKRRPGIDYSCIHERFPYAVIYYSVLPRRDLVFEDCANIRAGYILWLSLRPLDTGVVLSSASTC